MNLTIICNCFQFRNWELNCYFWIIYLLHLFFSTVLLTLFLLTALVIFSLQDIDGLWLTDQPAIASARKTLGIVSWSDLVMSADLLYVGGIGTARWKVEVWNFRLLPRCSWRSHHWAEWLKTVEVLILSIFIFPFPLSHLQN